MNNFESTEYIKTLKDKDNISKEIKYKNVSIRKDGTLIGFSDLDYEFIIDSSIQKIGKTTHGGCNIKKLYLNNDIDIYPLSFESLKSLEEIIVPNDSEKYLSIDGVLFSKDKTKLICFPRNKKVNDYHIPDGVEVIGENSFMWTHVTEVVAPKTLNKIESDAFICSNIYILNLLKAPLVKNLGARCLQDCGDVFVLRNHKMSFENVYIQRGNWGYKVLHFLNGNQNVDLLRDAIYNNRDISEALSQILK